VETSSDARNGAGDRSRVLSGGQIDGSCEVARQLLARPARGFARFLYSSNPFYILSADLVFVGLRISFGASGPASPWSVEKSVQEPRRARAWQG